MMFYVSDWLSDPALTVCHPASRGIWIDLLCIMHEKGRTGTISGTATQLAKLSRSSIDELIQALIDLKSNEAAIVEPDPASLLRNAVTVDNIIITVANKRMQREHKDRVSNALRQQRYRDNRQSNGRIAYGMVWNGTGTSKEEGAGETKSEQKNPESDPNLVILPNTPHQAMGCLPTVEIPSLDEAIRATMTLAIPEDFCRFVYSKWFERDGKDGGMVPVTWLKHVQGRWIREGESWRNGSHKGKQTMFPDAQAPNTTPVWKQIEVLIRQIERSPANPKSKWHNPQCSPTDKEFLKKMREKLRELNNREAQGIVNAK